MDNPDKAPSAALARCKVCKDLMVLLLQLNGELPERFLDTNDESTYSAAEESHVAGKRAASGRIRGFVFRRTRR